MPLTQAMRDLLGQLIIGAGTSFVFNNAQEGKPKAGQPAPERWSAEKPRTRGSSAA